MQLMSLIRKNIGIVLCCLVLTSACSANSANWQTIAPGVEYVQLNNFPEFPNGSLHAFRLDLHKYNLTLAPIKQADGSALGLAQLAQKNGAILAVNGGFFSNDMKPLGLRISEGQTLNPLRAISWWGVFLTRQNAAQIVARKNFSDSPDIRFAIQAGPRLIVDGKIPKMSSEIDYRTALCITKSGKVIVAVTQSLLLSTTQLANVLQDPKFDCVDAINLDGGHSTQLFARTKDFELEVPSFAPIAEALLVTAKP